MTVLDFAKRRLIRLHPLIIIGMVLGAIFFPFQVAPAHFPNIGGAKFWQVILTMLIGFTLIPLPPSMDIRGWGEMHPLNGPAWSLFFEYVANILHVVILRKLPNLILGILVLLAAGALIHHGITSKSGDMIGGWSLDPVQFRLGLTRLLFPYMAGMLLRRVIQIGKPKNTFLWSALLLIIILSVPRIGGRVDIWMNGLYESIVIILIFPLIIYLGAIGEVKSDISRKVCAFLGDISYPLYITHFPFMCIFYAWVINNNIMLERGIGVGILLIIFSIGLAYASLKIYDQPVRKWLADKFLYNKSVNSK